MKYTQHQTISLAFVAAFIGPAVSFAPVAWADPVVPTISWQACGPEFPGVDCATVEVPLDYDRPNGQKIDLALARVPATDPDNKIGTLFLNPGGPGGSGVDLVLFGFGSTLSGLTQGRFDIVGFDPRGVAGSTPIRCFDRDTERDAFLQAAPNFPYENDQKRPFFDLYNDFTARCLARGQDITRHMSTADVARDLDRLRRAVGDRKLTYLGLSYGSYIGSTYANLFPNNIRSLVIDGVLNPRRWGWSLQIVSDRVATQEVFDEFLRLCDEAGPACGLSGPHGARARFDALAASLRAQPFTFPGGDLTYTYDRLITDATVTMYRPESWADTSFFFGFLADTVIDQAPLAQQALNARRNLDRFWAATAPTREEDYRNGIDAFFGNHCGDAQYPHRFFAFDAVSGFAEQGSQFGPYWWWFNSACATWPTAHDRYVGPWRTRTSAPVLVVGNFFDPSTDYAGAVATSDLLRNSRLLSYAGWGHTAFGRSQCATDHMVAYLMDGTLPPNGTVCPANGNPFLPQVADTLTTARTGAVVGLPPVFLRPSPTAPQ